MQSSGLCEVDLPTEARLGRFALTGWHNLPGHWLF
jgi:hypothetical protein